jgi:nucleotide-binding universal stress UspA family protein
MLTIRRILCPIDLSATSARALQHASALARWYGAALTVLYVDTMLPIEDLGGVETSGATASLTTGTSNRALQDVHAFAASASVIEPAPAFDVLVEESTHVDHAILEAARTLPADLIVMGTHGRSGVSGALLGSVTEHVLRSSSCPVMAVPPHDAVPPSTVSFKHILCAIDFSTSSLAGLVWALSLAEEADAKLQLLHVIEVTPELRASAVVTDREIDELHAAVEADVLAHLRALIPQHATDYCSIETATASGAAGHAILACAAAAAADLIVMGAQGQSALERFIFGSRTRDVLTGATCPVLAVRQ